MAIDAYARVLAKKAAGMTAPIIQDAVNQAAADGKITTGATAEQAAQIAQNTQDISELMRGGIAGENGGYYAPSVDADGNLTWIASQDGMTAVDGANIKGAPGDAGLTPTIGENGNWYLGDTDTGKPSRGADGDDGKSAYRYAQDGGYTGTEDEFAAKMAQGNEKWKLINYMEIAEGEEASSFEFTTDSDGNSFSLKKAHLLVYLPKYTGESSPPSYSFGKINGIFSGDNAPLLYTGFVVPSDSNARSMFWEAGINERGLWYEKNGRTTASANENYIGYSGSNNNSIDYEHPTGRKTDALYPIRSIGTQSNLIFPGCKFWLYGVKA